MIYKKKEDLKPGKRKIENMHNKHAKMKMEFKKASDKFRYFWLKYVSEIL